MAELTYITTCKGRLAHLKKSLPRIVGQHGVACVVVDYSCPEGTGDWVSANYPQVKLVRVEGQSGFSATKARNLGAQAATTPWLAFFDADVLVDPSFSAAVIPSLRPGVFFRAEPVTRQTWGSIIVHRDDFAAIGGYDETYAGWGSEDDDLIALLRMAGRRLGTFPASLLGEIPHDNAMRMKFHKLDNIQIQHKINHTYLYVKHDLMKLSAGAITPQHRAQLYDRITSIMLEVNDLDPNLPAVIELTLPGPTMRGPESAIGKNDGAIWIMEKKFVYTVKPRKP